MPLSSTKSGVAVSSFDSDCFVFRRQSTLDVIVWNDFRGLTSELLSRSTTFDASIAAEDGSCLDRGGSGNSPSSGENRQLNDSNEHMEGMIETSKGRVVTWPFATL